MRTVFRSCFLVNFGVDPAVMRGALPDPLEPDLYREEAYLSIVIAAMERMRPVFVPRCLGTTYHQVVYRAVVRCHGERGVYFFRSDADHRFMSAAGNLFTFFRFHYSPMAVRKDQGRLHFEVHPAPGNHASIQATY